MATSSEQRPDADRPQPVRWTRQPSTNWPSHVQARLAVAAAPALDVPLLIARSQACSRRRATRASAATSGWWPCGSTLQLSPSPTLPTPAAMSTTGVPCPFGPVCSPHTYLIAQYLIAVCAGQQPQRVLPSPRAVRQGAWQLVACTLAHSFGVAVAHGCGRCPCHQPRPCQEPQTPPTGDGQHVRMRASFCI